MKDENLKVGHAAGY